jgi:glycosyltransferase involved in cell wall biosynthesis
LISVIEQVYNNVEIIVVDDGSTDESAKYIGEIMEQYVESDIKYVYQENAGVAIARNTGFFKHSRGDAILCLDADDAIGPLYLQLLVPELFAEPQIGVVYTSLLQIRKKGKPVLSEWPDKFDADKHFFGRFNQVPTAALAKRAVWRRLGGQRQRCAPLGAGAEDGDFWLRAGAFGFDIKYVHPKYGQDSMFHYSIDGGLVSGNRQYAEVPFREWYHWTQINKRNLMPTPSIAKPIRYSHPARQYDEPHVSVIIPVGPGHVSGLVEALDSLDAQTFKKWEAIVVFDIGDTEWKELARNGELDYVSDTWPFCRFTSTNSGGRLAREFTDTLDVVAGDASLLAGLPAGKPKGAGAARNAGIRLARAPLLIFLDADDYFVAEALEKMVAAYKVHRKIIFSEHYGIAPIPKDKLHLVDGKVMDYNEKSGLAVIRQGIADYNCEKAREQPYTDGRTPYVICNVSSLIPKKWAVKLGGFPEDMASWEDVLFWWMASWKGYCFHKLSEPLLVYRYYTGHRRELGRKIAHSLLKHAEEVRERIGDMGCGCTGSPSSDSIIISTHSSGQGADMGTLRLSRGNQLQITDGDVVLVRFNPQQRGDQLRYGVHDFGGGNFINYGRLSGDEQMYAHIKDVETDEKLAVNQGREPQFIAIEQDPVSDIVVEGPEQEVDEILSDEPPEELLAIIADPEVEFDPFEEDVDDFPPQLVTFPPRLTPVGELDVGDLRSASRYVEILKEAGITRAFEVLQFDEKHEKGLTSISGIGPKARERFVNAAKIVVNS